MHIGSNATLQGCKPRLKVSLTQEALLLIIRMLIIQSIRSQHLSTFQNSSTGPIL